MEQYNIYGNNKSDKESDLQHLIRMRRRVPVNTGIILINIIVFLLVEFTGSSLNTQHMLKWGAAGTLDIAIGHEYYRLFTCMFLHFGIQHLGNNMLVLLFVGDCLERNIGKIKYTIIYLVGGLGASCISFALELSTGKYVVSAGASGAVFAVIGALLYVIIRNKGHIENFTSRQILLMAALSLYHGITSVGVDNAAHFGGLVCGLVLGILLYRRK